MWICVTLTRELCVTREDISVQALGNLIVVAGPVVYLCMGMSAKVSSLCVIVRMRV